MSIYDPLGFFSPGSIKAKIMMQKIWKVGFGWDDNITNNIFQKWLVWLKGLKEVTNIEVPKCYSTKFTKANSIKMHIFSDASEDVYATAIHLRFVYPDEIQVKLVVSKAGVAPLKVLTIPKL
ncbi:hypothetical protein JTB14_006039 [Gonioctena quinquepunctata]|nr:hypothetical protein JTB14_006039 [Gonioctena quinquepunctata]